MFGSVWINPHYIQISANYKAERAHAVRNPQLEIRHDL